MPHPEILGEATLHKVAADLYAAGLVPELRREMTAAGRPMVDKVEGQALAIPSKGKKHTGLRRALANTVEFDVTVRPGVWPDVVLHLGSNSNKMPGNQQAMPAAMNKRRFRHPVYGDRAVWVPQRGYAWFGRGKKARLDQTRAAIDRAVETVRRKLMRRS